MWIGDKHSLQLQLDLRTMLSVQRTALPVRASEFFTVYSVQYTVHVLELNAVVLLFIHFFSCHELYIKCHESDGTFFNRRSMTRYNELTVMN